jgi:hypothetical protein
MSMLASKLPRTSRLPLARASINSEFAIGQRLQVEENSTPSEARLSQAGSQAGSHAGSQAGSHAGSQAGSHAGSQAGSHAGSQAGSHAGSQAGSHAGFQAGSQVGNRAGFQLAAGSHADSQQSCVQ